MTRDPFTSPWTLTRAGVFMAAMGAAAEADRRDRRQPTAPAPRRSGAMRLAATLAGLVALVAVFAAQ